MTPDKSRAVAHYTAMAAQAAQLAAGPVRIQACAVRAVTPQQMRLGAVVLVDLDLTPAQRFTAVAELLGTGMSEQEARDGLLTMFPSWFTFEPQPAPEVTESDFGEFLEASAA